MRLLRDHFYKWDEVVIGGNLNALFYAREKGCHILPNTLDSPFAYDKTGSLVHLGVNDLDAWQRLSYSLAMDGLNPLAGKIDSIKINSDDKIIVINVGTPSLIKISYNKLRVFDFEQVFGIPNKEKIEGFRVLDWFDVRSGMKHELDIIEDTSTDFVKKIHFYLSERIDGNKDKKDLIAESILTKKQINDIDYSESISRFKVLNMMKEAGITGKGNGLGRKLPVKIELWKREVRPIKSIQPLEKGDIIVDNRTIQELTNEFSSCRADTAGRSAA